MPYQGDTAHYDTSLDEQDTTPATVESDPIAYPEYDEPGQDTTASEDVETPQPVHDTDDQDTTTASNGASNRQPNRSHTRKAATKALHIADMAVLDPVALTVAGLVLASETDTVSLTVAVQHATKRDHAILDKLDMLLASNTLEIGVALMSMERADVRTLWAITAQFNADNLAKTPPANDMKAALELGTAINDVSTNPQVTDILANVRDILKRA